MPFVILRYINISWIFCKNIVIYIKLNQIILYTSSGVKKKTCPGARDKFNFRQDKHTFSPNVQRASQKFCARLYFLKYSVPLYKSGLTLHNFRRTMDQIGCDMSRRVIVEDRGK